MIIDTLGFVFILMCYMLIVSTVFTILFQADESGMYSSMSDSFLTLYMAFIGNYNYTDSYIISNSICMDLHIICSHIFLMNYLISILTNVYTLMMLKGDESFKKNMYQFIEKYLIPLKDQHGYQELVIHPAPLNVFALILLPFTVSRAAMKRMASLYAILYFWAENMLFLALFLAYEVMLIPYIIVKVFVTIMRLSSACNMIPLMIMWIVMAPIILLVNLMIDLANFIRILCDYSSNEDKNKIIEE